MKLSVVIPCYNEVHAIEAIVGAVQASGVDDLEIIVVDDGSTDGSAAVLQERIAPFVSNVIFHETNRGKGAAVLSSFGAATGEMVIVQDADLEYSPADYRRLLEPIISGKADAVFGSRFAGGQAHRVVYFWHLIGNKILTLFSNMCTNLNLTDMETCYKAVRLSTLRQVELCEDRFGFEPEITAKLARTKCRIYEVGISYDGRTYEEGKKITWKDGVRVIYVIVKYNFFAPVRAR